ncbi:MAG: acetate--CoA ligase family protein, partial [Chloroflexota bacterium]|nr:acetate--CoA ligase family protein [Chloroflexota bacterium]
MNSPATPTTDRAHDVLRSERRRLDAMFRPRGVAVIGASEAAGSPGRTILGHLLGGGFPGAIFPVHPDQTEILGLRAYPTIASLPGPVDLAVVVEAAPGVPALVRDCARAGVCGLIITSDGFRARGPEGAALEQEMLEHARRGGMHILGPDSIGIMVPGARLNAALAGAMARPGSVGFVSQSGALGSAILDWSFRVNVGFSAFVSVGAMLDVGWGDLIDYLGDDEQTQSIVIYMESIGDARSFLSAAREVALTKPIIVLKAGRTDAAARIAATHTGWLTGDDEVLDAAFRRCGVLRVHTIADLFHMAGALSKQPRPAGPRLTIVTNAGGPAVIATDALVASGGELAPLSAGAAAALAEALPTGVPPANPIDLGGDARPEHYRRAVDIALKDPAGDGVLVIIAPQAMSEPARTAERLVSTTRMPGKPILASLMGGLVVEAGEEILNRANIPTFAYPDTAARVFHAMWRYSYNLRALYETPMPAANDGRRPDRERVVTIMQQVQATGRSLLTEPESKELLAAYGVPVVPTRSAHSAEEAVAIAAEMGYPVVLKLLSATVTHKSEAGGVRLNLPHAEAVRRAYDDIRASATPMGEADFLGMTVQPMVVSEGYELILGATTDADFGPVLLFGSGGRLVEIYDDRVAGLPPFNTTLARRMIEQTRVFQALRGA